MSTAQIIAGIVLLIVLAWGVYQLGWGGSAHGERRNDQFGGFW